MRTLEQKISDAGPFPQRVDPHVLTTARNELRDTGHLLRLVRRNIPWFHLPDTPSKRVSERLDQLGLIHDRASDPRFLLRSGQCLEIAVFRALSSQTTLTFLGTFPDL